MTVQSQLHNALSHSRLHAVQISVRHSAAHTGVRATQSNPCIRCSMRPKSPHDVASTLAYLMVTHMALTSISRKMAERVPTRLSHQNDSQGILTERRGEPLRERSCSGRRDGRNTRRCLSANIRIVCSMWAQNDLFVGFFSQRPRPAHSLLWVI